MARYFQNKVKSIYGMALHLCLSLFLVSCGVVCGCNNNTDSGNVSIAFVPFDSRKNLYQDQYHNHKTAGIDSVVRAMAYDENGQAIGLRSLYFHGLGYIVAQQYESAANTVGAVTSDQYVYASIEIAKQPVLIVFRLPGVGIRSDSYTDATGHKFTYYNGVSELQQYKAVQAVKIESGSDVLTYYFARGKGLVCVVFNGVKISECIQ